MAAVRMRVWPSFLRSQICGWRSPKGVVGGCARHFLLQGNAGSSCTDIHSLHLHNIAHVTWQQLGCVCGRAFCVPKCEDGGPPRELLEAMRGNFCDMEMPGATALPATLFASIASLMRHGSSKEACVPELSAFLNGRLEVHQESCWRLCAAFFAPWKCQHLQRCQSFSSHP
jgi:hypothetical protein